LCLCFQEAMATFSLDSILRWRELFEAVKRETNSRRLARLIVSAEDAIFARWQELDSDAAERRELINATVFLCELKTKKNLGVSEQAS
jgi:hypothetical protein